MRTDGLPLWSQVLRRVARDRNRHLFDVSRYSDLFTRSRARGGLKDDPNDVVLLGIMPPLGPYEVILANPGTRPVQPYVACGALSENGNSPCVPMVQHSCRNPGKPEFFGDPPLRIDAVIKAAKNHATTSICADDYFGALDHLGKLIITSLRPNCLPPELARAGALECNVRDEILDPDGSVTAVAIPSCASAGGALPCWHVEPINDCRVRSPDGMALAIDRGGAPASGQRRAVASCVNPPIAK